MYLAGPKNLVDYKKPVVGKMGSDPYDLPGIDPISTMDPRGLKLLEAIRPPKSKPPATFGKLRNENVPLPTNSWCENLLLGNVTEASHKIFQLPYAIDAAGYLPGLRAHHVQIKGETTAVEMIYEPTYGFNIGANEEFIKGHEVASNKNLAVARMAVTLQWKSESYDADETGPMMYSPIVRGAPYISMVYSDASPRMFMEHPLESDPVVDQGGWFTPKPKCGSTWGEYSKPFTVHKELRLEFTVSDYTWILFVSEPTEFVCSSVPLSEKPPSKAQAKKLGLDDTMTAPYFDLKATKPMSKGMVRVAFANNCTHGKNPQCKLSCESIAFPPYVHMWHAVHNDYCIT
jgi:hypothetical protein